MTVCAPEPKVEHEPLTPEWVEEIFYKSYNSAQIVNHRVTIHDRRIARHAAFQSVIDAVSREVGSEFGKATLAALKKDGWAEDYGSGQWDQPPLRNECWQDSEFGRATLSALRKDIYPPNAPAVSGFSKKSGLTKFRVDCNAPRLREDLHAFVIAASEAEALERLRADDSCWAYVKSITIEETGIACGRYPLEIWCASYAIENAR